MDKNVLGMIRKYGKCEVYAGRSNKSVYSVICQGCGKKIWTSDDVEPGCTITKRGTAMFWHPECVSKVEKNKILWRDDR